MKRFVAALLMMSGALAAGGVSAAAVQLNFDTYLNANVARNVHGDFCDFDASNRCYLSQSAAAACSPSQASQGGLPDNGLYSSTSTHPDIQLKPFNVSPGANNAWKVNSTGTTTFNVTPAGQYSNVHVIASSGGSGPGNPAQMSITLNYSDGSSSNATSFDVADWFGTVSDPGYVLQSGMARYDTSACSYTLSGASVFGFPVHSDPSKTLRSVSINITQIPGGGVFSLYGATATTSSPPPLISIVSSIIRVGERLLFSITNANLFRSISFAARYRSSNVAHALRSQVASHVATTCQISNDGVLTVTGDPSLSGYCDVTVDATPIDGSPVVTSTQSIQILPPTSIPSLSEWMQLMLALMAISLVGWHFHRERSY